MEDDMNPRLKAILAELEKDAQAYLTAKAEFDGVRVQFEAARERLSTTRRLGAEIMSSWDWMNWRLSHATVRYAGVPIGDAVLDVLADSARQVAKEFLDGGLGPTFDPFMSLDDIAEGLESGGYEFRSSAPNREINMALTRLTGIDKNEGRYAIAGAEQILDKQKNLRKQADEARERTAQFGEMFRSKMQTPRDRPAGQS